MDPLQQLDIDDKSHFSHFQIFNIPTNTSKQEIESYFKNFGKIAKFTLFNVSMMDRKLLFITLRDESFKCDRLYLEDHLFQGNLLQIFKISAYELKNRKIEIKNSQFPFLQLKNDYLLQNIPLITTKAEISDNLSPFGLIQSLKFSKTDPLKKTRTALLTIVLPTNRTFIESMKKTLYQKIPKVSIKLINTSQPKKSIGRMSKFPWLYSNSGQFSKQKRSIYQRIRKQNFYKRHVRRRDRELFRKQIEEEKQYLKNLEAGISDSDSGIQELCVGYAQRPRLVDKCTLYSDEEISLLLKQQAQSSNLNLLEKNTPVYEVSQGMVTSQVVKIVVMVKEGNTIFRKSYRSESEW